MINDFGLFFPQMKSEKKGVVLAPEEKIVLAILKAENSIVVT